MTIAVAVRTGSAVVFAADSKVTTQVLMGWEKKKGKKVPRFVDQTYDNATKVVHDRNLTLMVMVAGSANIGQVPATDFISTQSFPVVVSLQEQDTAIKALVDSMVELKRAFWSTTPVDPKQWPGPTLLLAAPSPTGGVPRVWRVDLEGEDSQVTEILQAPGIRMEGSYNEVFGLLYGWEPIVLTGILKELRVKVSRGVAATQNLKVLRPIDKLSLWGMPIQDAIDLAVFLATVQVEMDRFLPGIPACGGPIDVLVLRMAPQPGILAYPGKTLHHPRQPE